MPSSRLALAVLLLVLLLVASGCDDRQGSADHRVLAGTEPAPSDACPHGGTRVLSGLDLDGNGVLDASEVTVTRDVCADAPSDPGALVRLDAEPPGSRCPRGGTAVRSGLDRNHDGILTQDEVITVDYLCRGQVLIAVERLDRVAGCLQGGVAIHTGQDEDGNGVLDTSEITATRTECSDAVVANAFVYSAAGVAALAHIKVITGTLTISGDVPIQVVLPDLEFVGAVEIVRTSRLASLSLPRLQRVGGMLAIHDNAELTEIRLPALEDVAQLLLIHDAPKLERVSLPALTRVGTALDLSGTPSLARVELGLLLQVGGDVQIRSAPALGKLDLSHLRFANGISIIDDRALTQVRLADQLRAAHVEIRGNPLLTSLDLGTAMAVNELTVEANDTLAVLAFPAVTGGRVVIGDNAALAELVVVLSSATVLEVSNNGLAKLTLEMGDGGASATIASNANLRTLAVSGARARDLRISSNPGLTELSIAVSTLESCVVDGDHITRLGFPSLTQATALTIAAPLETLELPTPRPAIASLMMAGTAGIEELSLEEMGTTALGLVSNRRLTRVVAGELTNLDITANPELVSMAMRGDRFVQISIQDNPKLASIAGLDRVRSIALSLIFGENALKRVDMPSLTSAGTVSLFDDTGFDAIDLHNLETVVGVLRLGPGVVEPPRFDALRHSRTVHVANTSLPSVSFPVLHDVTQLVVSDNDQLGELSFPALTELGSAAFTDNQALDVCKIEALFAATHALFHTQSGNHDTGSCP